MRGGILVFLSIPQRVATKQYRITYLISFVLQLRIKPTQYFKWDMNISVLWGDVPPTIIRRSMGDDLHCHQKQDWRYLTPHRYPNMWILPSSSIGSCCKLHME